jgi:hypothetical protein
MRNAIVYRENTTVNMGYYQSYKHQACALLKADTLKGSWQYSVLRYKIMLQTRHSRKKNSLVWVRERTMPSGRPLSAKLVPTFADRRCHGFLCPYSRLPREVPLVFLSSSSSIVLTRLSGPRCRPNTSQKSGSAGNRTLTSRPVARNSDH